MKVSKADWGVIRALAEAGKAYPEIAADYPITVHAIYKRASEERWVTPMRLSKAEKGKLPTDDPASAVAALWSERGERSREDIYQGASKALQRFFAMQPVPLTFGEAAIAKKFLDETITPPKESDKINNMNIAILTQAGFEPKDVSDPIDV